MTNLIERGSIVLIESETGSGKTEAAIMHGLRLYEAGAVDGIYFALPTRTSAVQIHGRVERAVKAAFGGRENAPPVVLAVPGYFRVDEQEGQPLPMHEVRWDENVGLRGWAAENSKRFLAAGFAIGTIDQALMSVLCIKHAHMRAASITRSLLVIDEVHASDEYMSVLSAELVRRHVACGGHVLLMSATLGAEAAARYFGGGVPSMADAVSLPYPLIRWRTGGATQSMNPDEYGNGKKASKTVVVDSLPIVADDNAIAQLAARAARDGAKVLVIRNTVDGCVRVRRLLAGMVPPDLLFAVNGVSTCHHGRFAPEDRRLLDGAVEHYFGRKRPDAGMALVATQTVEQSIDIDADILITDACPMDVLLQRIGRLHRHSRDNRPPGYRDPRCIVLFPHNGLMPLTKRAAFGIGMERAYSDVRIVELTRRKLEATPVLIIPGMNRELVEAAVHPEARGALDAEDPGWLAHGAKVFGQQIGERTTAVNGLIHVDVSFSNSDMVRTWKDDARLSTRLGLDSVTVNLEAGPVPSSPFGNRIRQLTIPRWMVPAGLEDDDVEMIEQDDGGFTFRAGDRFYRYDADGLGRLQDREDS
jgi:CRISPR-associated endonuclease/helicase Cas3